MCAGEFQPLDKLAKPLLLKNLDAVEGIGGGTPFADGGEVSQAVASFKSKFEDSKNESKFKLTGGGRAERAIKGASLAAAKQLFEKVVLPGAYLHFDKMHADLQPTVFGIVKSCDTVAPERGRGASLRLNIDGVRTIIMCPTEALKTFMAKQSMTVITPETVQSFMKAMTKDVIDAYLANGGVMCHATVRPKEALLLPFNWLFAERVSRGSDVIGIRISFWLRSDEDVMDATSRWLIAVRRANAYMQNALECFVTSG